MKMSGINNTKDLLALTMPLCDREGVHPTSLPGFRVVRRDKTTEASPGMYAPLICLVLQGEKCVWSGKTVYRYNPAHYLVSCIDVPATVQVVKASPHQPYVGLTLELQPSVVYEVLRETSSSGHTASDPGGGFFVERVTPELANAFGRLLGLLGNEDERKILAPSIIREIHYRLMNSKYGARVRQLGVVGSKTQRIGRVIEYLRKEFAGTLKVTDLARMANMSPSAFHLHFRQVTNMSPLQYQKQIRLQEARRLLSVDTIDAASVARQVGYESPSQFSREYRRLFGQPPMRDIDRFRLTGSAQD